MADLGSFRSAFAFSAEPEMGVRKRVYGRSHIPRYCLAMASFHGSPGKYGYRNAYEGRAHHHRTLVCLYLRHGPVVGSVRIASANPVVPCSSVIRIGGISSIDVTRDGVDKAYAMGKIKDLLHVTDEDIIFVGDALFKGGNDAPIKKTGVDYIQENGPNETEEFLRRYL